jgi:hypothetical protein
VRVNAYREKPGTKQISWSADAPSHFRLGFAAAGDNFSKALSASEHS